MSLMIIVRSVNSLFSEDEKTRSRSQFCVTSWLDRGDGQQIVVVTRRKDVNITFSLFLDHYEQWKVASPWIYNESSGNKAARSCAKY